MKPAVVAAVSVLLLGLPACSGEPVTVAPAPETAPSSASPSAAPTGDAQSSEPMVNDLEKSPAKRTFKSGGLTFNAEYATPAPVATWTANGPKAVRVSLTAVNNGKSGQKLYVTRASVRFTVRGGDEDLVGPDQIVDTANLTPGYLVTFPYSYEQSFAIPPLDESATALQLDFKYEVVSLVDKKAKDYTKQTANDTVRIALNF